MFNVGASSVERFWIFCEYAKLKCSSNLIVEEFCKYFREALVASCLILLFCFSNMQKGLKNVFDEAILAALEPPEPVKKRRCNILWREQDILSRKNLQNEKRREKRNSTNNNRALYYY